MLSLPRRVLPRGSRSDSLTLTKLLPYAPLARKRSPLREKIAVPADAYVRSTRLYRDATFTVVHCVRICFHGRKINLSHVFSGQNVGVTQVGDHVWLVTFMQYDLGYFDDETCRLEPIENPLGSKVLPMCSE